MTNNNLFAPQKFLIICNKFPDVQIFAQSVNIPSISSGIAKVATNQSVDMWQTGDKVVWEDLTVQFLLDEDMVTYISLYNWLLDSVQKNRKDFLPFSDFSVVYLTNNMNKNFTSTYHNAIPYEMSSIQLSSTSSEDDVLTVTVNFKYSHFTFENNVRDA